jgi:hypothetical protein
VALLDWVHELLPQKMHFEDCGQYSGKKKRIQ